MDNTPIIYDLLVSIVVIGLLLAIYFLPSIVAATREHHNRLSIFLLNLFLGWTLIGWVAALVWSASNSPVDDDGDGAEHEALVGGRSSTEAADATKICPKCAEAVKAAAKICLVCRYEFPA